MRWEWRRLLLDPEGEAGGGDAPPAAEPAPPAPAPPPADGGPGDEPQYESIRDALRGFGVDLDADDDESALRQLVESRQQLQQSQYLIQLGQAALPHQEQLYRMSQGQGGAPAPAAPPPNPVLQALQQAGYRQAPEWNPAWLQMVERDEQGGLRARQGQDPSIARRVEEYARWRDEQQETVLGRLPEILEAAMQPMVRQAQQQVLQQVEADRAQRLIDRHAADLLDPATSQLTPLGRAVQGHVEALGRAGVGSMEQRLDYALKLARAEAASPPQAPPSPGASRPPAGAQRAPQQGSAQARNRLIGRAVAPAHDATTRGMVSFEDMLRSEMVANGKLPAARE